MEKKTHLYRLRIVFNEDGSPNLVETVTKSVIVDGDQRHPAGEAVATFDPARVDRKIIAALLADCERVGAEMRAEAEAKKAEAERLAAERASQAEAGA